MSAVVVNCCPGRRCRIVKSRSRRGAAQRCRCTCACVCCQHTSIARRRRALPRSLPTTTTTTPARAPFAVRRAQRRQRAGVLRRLVGGLVSAPLEHVAGVVGRRRALPARIGGARRQERRRVRAAARSRPSSSTLTRSALARARRRRRRHALLWATAAARWSSVPSSTATRCSSACSSSSADPRARSRLVARRVCTLQCATPSPPMDAACDNDIRFGGQVWRAGEAPPRTAPLTMKQPQQLYRCTCRMWNLSWLLSWKRMSHHEHSTGSVSLAGSGSLSAILGIAYHL